MPEFDVFLSHNSRDKTDVRELARILTTERRLMVWLDEEQIQPSTLWMDALTQGLAASKTVAVLVGSSGFGPWQEAEARDAMQEAIEDNRPVFTVYLPGAPAEVDLPESLKFLRHYQGVDLRSGLNAEGIDRLVWGITGKKGDEIGPPDLDDLNPFAWRGGITDGRAFFGRTRELSTVRAFLRNRQNCQIVGPRRIGKTSLLRHIQREAAKWLPTDNCSVAFMDSQLPQCYTLAGWLKRVSQQFGWNPAATTLTEFAEHIDDNIAAGRRLVLCLDEVPELISRREQFPRDFLLTLRACGQLGLSIVTAAFKPLSELTDPEDDVSPFYNTFPLLKLSRFTDEEASDFVKPQRPGIPKFKKAERKAILEFARNHPLALQIGCQHVLSHTVNGDAVGVALREAERDIRTQLPTWES